MYDSVTGLLRVLNILISPVTLWGGNCNAPFPKIDGCGAEAVPWSLGRNWAWDIRSGCWLVGHRANGLCGPAYNSLFSLILLSLVSVPQPPCSRGTNHSALSGSWLFNNRVGCFSNLWKSLYAVGLSNTLFSAFSPSSPHSYLFIFQSSA